MKKTSKYTIQKDFHFSASHQLDGLPEGHQCGRLHGHNYIFRVIIEAEKTDDVGFVLDYGKLKPIGDYIDQELDHRHLNDAFDFNPTAENMAEHMAGLVANLVPVPDGAKISFAVSETPKTWSTFQGE